MKFSVSRDALLKPLLQVSGVVEKRQTLPVLANVLMVLRGQSLSLTGTDLEIELVANTALDGEFGDGEITVPAKKLVDICKSLPAESKIEFTQDGQRLNLKCASSRFSLSTLPASEFPSLEETQGTIQFQVKRNDLKQVADRTAFAMAQQDVRYYLNGMLFELFNTRLRTVATDGHRLAMSECEVTPSEPTTAPLQAIVPRKGVLEIARLLSDGDEVLNVILSKNHVRIQDSQYTFTSKLIDGRFPDYDRVIPKSGNKNVIGQKDALKQAFSRASILSNEKYRGVRLVLTDGQLQIIANNPEQEEAEETVSVDYSGESLEIGFNVSYLLDVLNAVKGQQVKFTLADSNSSALIEDAADGSAVYVVMPMRF